MARCDDTLLYDPQRQERDGGMDVFFEGPQKEIDLYRRTRNPYVFFIMRKKDEAS